MGTDETGFSFVCKVRQINRLEHETKVMVISKKSPPIETKVGTQSRSSAVLSVSTREGKKGSFILVTWRYSYPHVRVQQLEKMTRTLAAAAATLPFDDATFKGKLLHMP